MTQTELMQMATRLAAAYIEANKTPLDEAKQVLASFYQSLCDIQKTAAGMKGRLPTSPAVPVEDSIHDDYIVCLEDGKKLQMLKRHLSTVYRMTPEEYRERWGLPADYPMVAPGYAVRRSRIAKNTGLGRSGRRGMRIVEGRSGTAAIA